MNPTLNECKKALSNDKKLFITFVYNPDFE